MYRNIITGIALCGLAAASMADEAFLEGKALEQSVRDGWTHVKTDYYSPKTHLIYASSPAKVSKAADFKNGLLFLKDGKGYGYGMEDCAIVGGVALSMLVDQFAVTGEAWVRDDAHDIFLGLKNLVVAHGVPGFVARGLCVEDGKSICALSSRDQVTHFVHGLWRYYHSPLSDEAAKADIRVLFKAVADRMKRNCTPENDYDFLQADGTRNTERGICRMWNVYPHEIGRLPMIYAATYDVTGDATYKAYYETYIDEALTCSISLKDKPQSQLRGIMPCYTYLQMQSSFEVLLGVEKDAARRARMLEAMQTPAQMGADRALILQGRDEKYLCAAGETLLAQLMVPGRPFPDEQKSVLIKALHMPLLPKAHSCRAVHLAAAYWRMLAR